MNCPPLVEFLSNHKFVVGLVATAGIITMPSPGSPLNWKTLYQWFYDWVHQFLNLRRPMQPAERPIETPANLKR